MAKIENKTTEPIVLPGGAVTGSSSQIQVPSSIARETLSSDNGVNIPELTSPEEARRSAMQNVSNAGTQTTDFFTNLLTQQQAETTAGAERTSLTGQLTEALEGAKGRGEALVTERESLGVPESTRQLQDINQQIAQMQGNLRTTLADEQAKFGTVGFKTGKLASIERQTAAKIGSLSVMAQALQGNIALAKQTAQETVDLKYADVEQEISNITTLLEVNRDNMTLEQQKRADSLNIQLQARQEKIDEQKELDNNKSNVMLKAAEFNAPQNILTKIQKADTLFDAISAAKGYLSPVDEEGNWSTFENVAGETMLYDKNTGTIKPVEVNQSTGEMVQDSYIDGSGITWNITGWAVDPTKAKQMQNIADRIGKVDDGNIDAKVSEFTPGLTADMIRETSAKTGVSWEAIMAMVNQEASGGLSRLATGSNNFGGLTFNNQEWIKPYGGEKGKPRPSAEGGHYIKFPDKQSGLDAMGALIASYGTVIPEEAQVDTEVDAFVQRVNAGAMTDAQALKEITKGKQRQLVEALATTPKETDEISVLEAKDKLQEIENLKSSSALNDAVGTNFFGRDWSMFDISKITGDYQQFIGGVSLLTDQLTLDKLVESKARGATFGALSERELQMLSNSASKIGSWARYKKDGVTVKGYDIDEKSFKKELDTIGTFYRRDIERKGGSSIRTMEDGTSWVINQDGTLTQI
jgi:hypothetical protein